MKLMKSSLKIIENYLSKSERTKKLASDIFNSFLIKIFSVLAAFMLIPVSLNYVNKADYGLWLTISAIIGFAGILDLGLTSGLKNRISESYANDNQGLVKTYLSTSYVFLLVLISNAWLIFIFLCDKINWQGILSTTLDNSVLIKSLKLIFTSFCLQFVLQPITSLLMAKQKHYLLTTMQLCGNGLALVAILLLGPFFKANSFLFLSIVLGFSYPVVLLMASIVLYKNSFASVIPSIKSINFHHTSRIFDLGIKFFIIQVAVIIMYYSNNIIISQTLGNESVTTYNIAFRYFSMVKILHTLIVLPLWTAVTDAYVLNDYKWIKQVIRNVNRVNIFLCVIIIIMCLCSSFVYKVWIGHDFTVPLTLNLLLGLSTGIGLFTETYIMFINGTGRISLQMYYCILGGILHFPLAYLLIGTYGLGLPGIVVLNIFWTTIAVILWYFQYRQIVNKGTEAVPALQIAVK